MKSLGTQWKLLCSGVARSGSCCAITWRSVEAAVVSPCTKGQWLLSPSACLAKLACIDCFMCSGRQVWVLCAGLTFGVAKNATLVAVRALDCSGEASYSDIIMVCNSPASSSSLASSVSLMHSVTTTLMMEFFQLQLFVFCCFLSVCCAAEDQSSMQHAWAAVLFATLVFFPLQHDSQHDPNMTPAGSLCAMWASIWGQAKVRHSC